MEQSRSGLPSDEQPLLLHPEIDEPNLHLKFTAFGTIVGITERGKESIKICRLNRSPLRKARQRVINYFLVQCEIIFAGKRKWSLSSEFVDDFLIAELKLLKAHRDDPNQPYTSLVEYILRNPETCILPRIEAEFQADFLRAFEQFKQEESI